MATLSILEKEQLSEIFKAAKGIQLLLNKESDSINDVVYEQVLLRTASEEDKEILNKFMQFIQQAFPKIELIIEKSELLTEHFIGA